MHAVKMAVGIGVNMFMEREASMTGLNGCGQEMRVPYCGWSGRGRCGQKYVANMDVATSSTAERDVAKLDMGPISIQLKMLW
jgi:hypothetical protein